MKQFLLALLFWTGVLAGSLYVNQETSACSKHGGVFPLLYWECYGAKP